MVNATKNRKKSKKNRNTQAITNRAVVQVRIVKPGINPLFLSQKIAQKLPLKKIPSTTLNATTRSANEDFLGFIHFIFPSYTIFFHLNLGSEFPA